MALGASRVGLSDSQKTSFQLPEASPAPALATVQVTLSGLPVEASGEAASAVIRKSGGGGAKPPMTSIARAL